MADLTIIEEKIKSVLDGGAQVNALDFSAFLRSNGIMPKCYEAGGDGWSVMYKEDSIGFILVNGAEQMPGPWTVWFNTCEFGDGDGVEAEVKEAAWEHASVCANFTSGGKDCGCGDQPGFHREIFGREYENRCHSPLMFTDPDAKTLESVKKLMLLIKRNADAA